MQNITLNATIQDGNITFNLNDFVKLIQSTQITNTEYKPTPQAMAFDTKRELDEYVKNNPLATCKGIATNDLVEFIYKNKGKYLFLKGADLRDANLCGANLGGAYLGDAYLGDANLGGAYLGDAYLGDAYLGGANLGGAYLGDAYLGDAYLGGANLRGANLCGANLGGAYLGDAYLGGANLRGANLCGADLSYATYDSNTTFPDGFTIPDTMIKL